MNKKNFIISLASVIISVASLEAEVVSQWSFENNLNDTATGGVNADNLTDNTSGISYVTGVIGQAVKISNNGGSDKLTATNSADITLGSNWTLEAFVFRDADNNTNLHWERFWTKWGEGGQEFHVAFRGLSSDPVTDGLDLFINDNINLINHNSTSMSAPSEEWFHVAIVSNQSDNSITGWINGVQVGSAAWQSVSPKTGNMNFGNFGGDNGSAQFSGWIDEAQIHDVAVTSDYLAGRTALITAIPEPSSISLIGCVGILFLFFRNKLKSS